MPKVPCAPMRLRLPTLPNFVQLEGHETFVDVADIETSHLAALGEAWKLALLDHAQDRRTTRKLRKHDPDHPTPE